MHLDPDLQRKVIRVQGLTFGGHHSDVLKASKRKHKVQEYGLILVGAMWQMEPG